jgi:hypothetical protein
VYNYQPATRRRRRGRALIITLAVLIVILVGADFGTKALAENILASQIKSHGFPTRPNVSIAGFPFLTQVITRDLQQITISANNVKTGPVTITTISVRAKGVHIHGNLHGATIDSLNGTAFIGFPSLAQALTSQIGPLGSALTGSAGLTLHQSGPNEITARLDLLVTTASITWRITQVNGHEINLREVSSSGVPSSLFGAMQSVNLPIPSLPMGLVLQRLSVTPSGVLAIVVGHSLSFSQ